MRPEAQWFATKEFREVIAPRARDMVAMNEHSADEVKAALTEMLVTQAHRQVRLRAPHTSLRDHPADYEEILVTRIWQAVQAWDCVRIDGLCSLLGAQAKFAQIDAVRSSAEASRRTRLYGGRFQQLEDQLVQGLGRQLNLAEKRAAARKVLPDSAGDDRVDEIVDPVRVLGFELHDATTRHRGGIGRARRGRHLGPLDAPGPTPEDQVLERWAVDTVHAWLETVPARASAPYRRWRATRKRADSTDPPPYTLRPLLPHVPALLEALGEDALVVGTVISTV